MENISKSYALDTDGKPTTGPETALQGATPSNEDPEGSGLAQMFDIFGGLIVGAICWKSH
jgi:LDH2 family malate/lactate/ureidoglycolate dehydrogenase